MTIPSTEERQLRDLRTLRNAVIGSRTRKASLVAEGRVPQLVELLASPLNSLAAIELQLLAVTILGSLAHDAPSSTLLSLLRAGTPRALFDLLAQIAQLGSNNPTSCDPLKMLETVLRSLRSILIALAEEVAPDPRYGLGVGRGSSSDTKAGLRGRSSREPSGWIMADAGPSSRSTLDTAKDGSSIQDSLMASASSSSLRAAYQTGPKGATLSPREEVTLLARAAIGETFSPELLPYLLGPLFLSPMPRDEAADEVFREAQAASRTRPQSPAVSDRTQFRRSSSLASSAGSSSTPDLSKSRTFSTGQPLAERGRILTLVETVANIMSICISVPGTGVAQEGSSSSSSPEADLNRRKQAVVAFASHHSPFVRLRRSSDAGLSTSTTTETPTDPSLLEVLLEAAECGIPRTQEAALWALAELTRDSVATSVQLFKCHTPSGLLPTSMLLSLRNNSNAHVRLAAFACLAHIIKVHPFTPRTNQRVLAVLIELLEHPGEIQIAAAFAIAKIVADDPSLQATACNAPYNCMSTLGALLATVSKSNSSAAKAWSTAALSASSCLIVTDDPVHRLQEGVLSALAALTFTNAELRRQFMDASSPPLLPLVLPLLSSGSLGSRIAACRLIRALSRSISILRTSLVDAGVADKLLVLLKNDDEPQDILTEVTATLCNLVLSYAPMRQLLLDKGGISKLIELCKSSHGPTRLNSLWAIKNALYASDTSFKRQLMEQLGWNVLLAIAQGTGSEGEEDELLGETKRSIEVDEQECLLQAEALSVIRNLTSSREADIDLTLQGFGQESLFNLLETVTWQRSNDLVTEQVAYILVNISTGNESHRRAILERANLMDALVYFLTHPRAEVKVPGLWAGMNLTSRTIVGQSSTVAVAQGGAGAVKTSEKPITTDSVAAEAVLRLKRFGFDAKLKPLVDDPVRDVKDRAKILWSRFEN